MGIGQAWGTQAEAEDSLVVAGDRLEGKREAAEDRAELVGKLGDRPVGDSQLVGTAEREDKRQHLLVASCQLLEPLSIRQRLQLHMALLERQ